MLINSVFSFYTRLVSHYTHPPLPICFFLVLDKVSHVHCSATFLVIFLESSPLSFSHSLIVFSLKFIIVLVVSNQFVSMIYEIVSVSRLEV